MKKKSKKKKQKFVWYIHQQFIIPIVAVFFLLTMFFSTWHNVTSPICANAISCINDLSGKFALQETVGVFLGQKVVVPSERTNIDFGRYVLGDTTAPKRIEIDLANQKLYGFEGDTVVHEYLVSTGKWGRTPTGEFTIWVKLRYTRMSGGNKVIGTYYNLPNVPYTMFFYNEEIPKARGYGIHGTYWHNNFGHPMSHGCINMRTEDVEKLYAWAEPPSTAHTTYAKGKEGTKIVIYGIAPTE